MKRHEKNNHGSAYLLALAAIGLLAAFLFTAYAFSTHNLMRAMQWRAEIELDVLLPSLLSQLAENPDEPLPASACAPLSCTYRLEDEQGKLSQKHLTAEQFSALAVSLGLPASSTADQLSEYVSPFHEAPWIDPWQASAPVLLQITGGDGAGVAAFLARRSFKPTLPAHWPTEAFGHSDRRLFTLNLTATSAEGRTVTRRISFLRLPQAGYRLLIAPP